MPFAHPARPKSYLHELRVPPGRLRVAFSSETPSGRPIDPEVRRALEDTAQLLVELGHDVREQGLGIDYRALYRAQGALGAAGSAAGIAETSERLGREPREDELEPLTWAGIRSGPQALGRGGDARAARPAPHDARDPALLRDAATCT